MERYTGFEPVRSAWKSDMLTVEHQYRKPPHKEHVVGHVMQRQCRNLNAFHQGVVWQLLLALSSACFINLSIPMDWCLRWDLNPYVLRQRCLRPPRLPIPTLKHVWYSPWDSNPDRPLIWRQCSGISRVFYQLN